MGYALVNELTSRGLTVTAFARNRQKLEKLYGKNSNVHIIDGDVLHLNDIKKAAEGADIIFHTISFPY